MYSALRDHDPVHHVVPAEKPDHDYWVLSRHADVWEAALDNETFSSALPRCPGLRGRRVRNRLGRRQLRTTAAVGAVPFRVSS
jgi:cytochrome P450